MILLVRGGGVKWRSGRILSGPLTTRIVALACVDGLQRIMWGITHMDCVGSGRVLVWW
jgi:hypothetical protein